MSAPLPLPGETGADDKRTFLDGVAWLLAHPRFLVFIVFVWASLPCGVATRALKLVPLLGSMIPAASAESSSAPLPSPTPGAFDVPGLTH